MIELLENEKFVPVNGFPGYEISNYGRLISCSKIWYAGKENSQRRTKNVTLYKNHYDWQGYNHQSLRKNNKAYDVKICKLVAKHFVPNPHNKSCVNHKDGVKSNDFFTNLEWVTHKENTQHAHKIGLSKPSYGSKNGMSRLTEEQVLFIRENCNSNHQEYADKFGVTKEHIKSIIKRRNWIHI